MVDGHVHLEFGELTVDYVMEFVNEAMRKGIHELQILDHTHRFVEFKEIYENLKKYPKQKEWLESNTKFRNTLDEYQTLIDEVKKLDLPIQVTFGLEVCYVPKYEEMIRNILKDRNYDFLLFRLKTLKAQASSPREHHNIFHLTKFRWL